MDEFLWGLAGSIAMLIIGGGIALIKKRYKKRKVEKAMLQKHEEKLNTLTEMTVLQLKFDVAIGKAFEKLGVNGDVKKCFEALTTEVIDRIGE